MSQGTYRLSKDTFVERSTKVHGDKYDYSNVEYRNQITKVKIVCPIHGEFWQTPKNHMKGQGCPKCGEEYAKTFRKNNWEHFVKESVRRFGECYEYPRIKEEYENSHSKITLKCKVCGNEFIKIACDHLTSPNGGCSHYEKTTSKLEDEIRNFLEENNISYVRQKKFEWLGQLELDFYLPNYNVAIECQGIQHFKAVDWFGGDDEFEKTIMRDKLKKELCSANGVKLLYYSNIGIEYPYDVYEDKCKLLEEIRKL